MDYRTLAFLPDDETAWVEALHAVLESQARKGFHFVGAVTRDVAPKQVGGMAGRASTIQSTALVFAKDDA